MKAVIFEEVGAGLQYKEIEVGDPHRNQVKVDIRAAALNHRDLWITKGMYPGIRPGIVLGSDAVGLVEGRRVIINPGLDWGSNEAVQSDSFRVLGMPDHGTFAEHIVIDRRYVYDCPPYLTDEEAAALPLAGVTAYRVLFARCGAKAGDKVLISGIGGGVALMAAQMAIAQGCEVWVTSGSEEKIQKAISLGAAGGVNYKADDWSKKLYGLTEGGVDVVIDSAGGEGFQHFIKLCKPGARIGFYGATLGKFQNLNPQLMFWRQISLLGSTMGSDRDFADMLAFVEKYELRPVVDSVYSLADHEAAFGRMEAGDQFGKIVLEVQG